MSTNMIAGLLATFIPLFTVGYLMLNKKPPIFRMFVAMLLVGLGYLTATGAIEDIGKQLIGRSPAAVEAPAAKEAAKPAAPAPDAPKADAPADAKPAGAY
jgi:hypothetical protein